MNRFVVQITACLEKKAQRPYRDSTWLAGTLDESATFQDLKLPRVGWFHLPATQNYHNINSQIKSDS